MARDARLGSALPSLEWAVQRRLDDLIGKLESKYGDLRGRIDLIPRPEVSFDVIGGAEAAKAAISGLSYALRMPELYEKWGIPPPRGGLLYGPHPGQSLVMTEGKPASAVTAPPAVFATTHWSVVLAAGEATRPNRPRRWRSSAAPTGIPCMRISAGEATPRRKPKT